MGVDNNQKKIKWKGLGTLILKISNFRLMLTILFHINAKIQGQNRYIFKCTLTRCEPGDISFIIFILTFDPHNSHKKIFYKTKPRV